MLFRSLEDANLCFQAIALASPAGLGDSAMHDVHQPADCTLLQAMQFAAARDLIAKQYANDFNDILVTGTNAYLQAKNAGFNAAWSTSALYLTLLAEFEDSHVLRKNGEQIAAQLKNEAKNHLQFFLCLENPKLYQQTLLQWDKVLKLNHINPGTCADLTVATLLVISINSHLSLK